METRGLVRIEVGSCTCLFFLIFPGHFWAGSMYDDRIADDYTYVYFVRLSLNVQKRFGI